MFLTRLLKNTPKLIQSTLWSWGNNSKGMAGDSSAVSSGAIGAGLQVSKSSPVQVGSDSWKMTAGTYYGTAAIKSDGTLWTWGGGGYGNLGTNDSYDNQYNAKQVEVGNSFTIVAGRTGTAAIDSLGRLWVWGNNAVTGRLGVGDLVNRSEPVQIMSDKSFTAVAMDYAGMGAIDTNGQLWVTGTLNKFTNDKTTDAWASRSSPSQVGGLITKTSTTYTHSLQLDEYGRIWAWGGVNSAGELGNLSVTAASSPVVVSTPVGVSFSQVSAGVQFSLGLATNGAVYAWGLGTSGQLGNSAALSTSSPVLTLSGKSCVMISAGYQHAAAIDTVGQLWTWGVGTSGQLGNNAAVTTSSPVQVPGSWTYVHAGKGFHGGTVAIKTDGTAWVWGNNSYVQLGLPTNTNKSSPTQLGSDTNWSYFSIGQNDAFGIKSDGSLWNWGMGADGSSAGPDGINTGYRANRWGMLTGFSPRSVVTVTSHNSGSHHAAIDSTGAMWVWGNNANGRLGLNSTAEAGYHSPVQLGLSSWIAVKATASGFVAIDAAYRMFHWGTTNQNSGGMPDPIFTGDTTATGVQRSSPVQIGLGIYSPPGGVGYAISSSTSGGALIDATGQGLWTWGVNAAGQLGNGTTVTSSFNLVKVGTGSWSMVSVVADSVAAIDSLGQLWAWGQGAGGVIGDNTTVSKSSPVQIMVGKSFTFVTGGAQGAFTTGLITRAAIDTLGQLWTWGGGGAGQLGDNTSVTKSSPVQVKPGTSFASVAAGNSNMYAIDSTGKLWGWGLGTSGQLGDNTAVSKSSPVQILSGSSFTQVAAGSNFFLAITTANVLVGAGANNGGLLGDNTVIAKSSPVVLHSGTAYSWVRTHPGTNTGGLGAFAKTTGGAWRGWGLNTSGQLGDGTLVTKSSPVAVQGAMFAGDLTSTTTSPVDIVMGSFGTWAWNSQGDTYWTGVSQVNMENLVLRAITTSQFNFVGSGKKSWIALDATDNNVAAVDSTGALYIGGANASGQFGILTAIVTQTNAAMRRYGSGSFTSVGLGDQTTYGIDSLGRLWAWGLGTVGQLGDSTIVSKSSPIQIQAGSSFVAVSSKSTTAYAIASNGNIKAWGLGTAGQIGNNAALSTSAPTLIGTATGTGSFTQIAASASSVMALDTAGRAYGWGAGGAVSVFGGNYSPDGAGVNRSAPIQVAYPAGHNGSWTSVYAISGPGTQSWGFLRSQADSSLWGMGNGGVAVNSLLLANLSPVQIGSSSWSAVAAAYPTAGLSPSIGTGAAGITVDGKLWAWGNGQLGEASTTVGRSSPIQQGAGMSFTAVNNGVGNFVAIRSSYGDVWAWGSASNVPANHAGANTSYPILALGGRYSWTTVSVGMSNWAAITSEGRLFVWGDNTYGLLTQGTTSPQGATGLAAAVTISQPCALGLIPGSWTAVSQNYSAAATPFIMALNSVGKVFTWGVGTSGQLGDGSIVSKSSPVAILATSSVTAIASGGQGGLALDILGRVWSWNGLYAGNGSVAAVNSPVQVGRTSFTKVATTENGITAAILSDGSIWVVGGNGYGQLGTNTTVSRSVPVQVTTNITGSSFTQIAASLTNTWAIDVTGKLWGWGAGGAVGDNTSINRSAPVQVSSSESFTFVSSSAGGGTDAVYAITASGQVQTWNSQTYLPGDTAAITRSSPVAVTALAGISVVNIGSGGGGLSWYIDNNYALWAWGVNTYGALGDGTTVTRSSPIQITWGGNVSWIAASAGYGYLAAIDSLGRVWASGYNGFGNLGDGTVVSKSSPLQVDSSFSGYSFIAAGSQVGALLWAKTTGAVRGTGWGAAIGDGTSVNKSSPVSLAGSFASPSTGQVRYGLTVGAQLVDYFTGTLFNGLNVWGQNSSGRVGNSTAVDLTTPAQFQIAPTGRSFTQVYGGTSYMAMVESNGTVWGWGRHAGGGLGNAETGTQNTSWPFPLSTQQVVSGQNVVGVTASPKSIALEVGGATSTVGGATRIVDSLGRLVVLGTNNQLQFGMRILNSPVQLGAESNWSTLAAGDGHFLATRTDGTLYGWGLNNSGQIGDSSVVTRSSPTLISSSSWTQVAAGWSHSAALLSDGRVFTWGNNAAGELGTNTTTSRSSPAAIATVSAVTMRSSAATNFFLDGAGNVYGTGYNVNGELGNNLAVSQSKYTLVVSGKSFTSMVPAVGGSHGGIDNLGRLWVWGLGTSGQLGDITITSKSSPVQIPGSWTAAALGLVNGYGIKSDGTLWSWGSAASAMLGDVPGSNGVSRSSPAQIGYAPTGSVSWTVISITKINQNAAIKSDGTLWTWGLGTSGQLGDNTAVSKSSPVQIIGVAGNWGYVSCSIQNNYTMAIKSDGKLFGWGLNTTGQIGDATLVTKSSPVAVKAGTSFTMVAAGHTNTFAIDSLGQLWGWGRAGANGSGTSTSSPVQISGSWLYVATSETSPVTVSAGIQSDGKLYTWGQLGAALLGINSTSAGLLTPGAVTGDAASSSFTIVSLGASHAVAIDVEGKLWAWGYNSSGQLGDGTASDRSQPTLISSESWSVAKAIGNNTWAVKNGVLYGWGLGYSAAAESGVGDGYTESRSSPVAVVGISGPATMNTLAYAAAVDPTAKTMVKMWGPVSNGRYGDNNRFTTTTRAHPIDTLQLAWYSYTMVGAGASFAAAVRTDGTLWTWGGDLTGQQGYTGRGGNLPVAVQNSPAQVPGTSGKSIVALNVGTLSIAALLTDGTVMFTGPAVSRGLNTADDWYATTPTTTLTSPKILGTKSWSYLNHSGAEGIIFGIDTNGLLWAWGSDASTGQYARGGIDPQDSLGVADPRQVMSGSWTMVVGDQVKYAIRSDGTLWSWGAGTNGELGNSMATSRSSPVQVGGSWTMVRSDSGGFAMGIKTDGTLWAWGLNANGTLAQNDTVSRSSPTQVMAGTSFTYCSAGSNNGGAIDTLGRLWTWGYAVNGEVGDLTVVGKSSPVQIPGSWTIVEYGQNSGFGIKTDGSLWGWGYNLYYTLADGTNVSKSSPVQIGQGLVFKSVMPRTYGARAVTTSGEMYTWGQLAYGHFSGVSATYSTPVQAPFTTSYKLTGANPLMRGVNGGQNYDAYLDNAGRAWVYQTGNQPLIFGRAYYNTAANNGVTFLSTPNQWSKVQVNAQVAVGRDTAGNLYAWGTGTSGQLAQNDAVTRSSPTFVSNRFADFAVGASFVHALDSLGNVYGFGSNTFGELGDTTAVTKSSPVVVNTGSMKFKSIAAGAATIAVDAVGNLVGWGNNGYGVVGDNTNLSRSQPIVLKVTTTAQFADVKFKSVAMGGYLSAAIDTNGRPWAWGYNESYNYSSVIGSKSMPTSIAAGPYSNFIQVGVVGGASVTAVGQTSLFGIDNNYGLWMWPAAQTDGVTGDNTVIARSTAVQVPGSWNFVGNHNYRIAIAGKAV